MVVLGWTFLALAAWVSRKMSAVIVINGSHPFEAMLIGIFIGALARNTGLFPKKFEPYLKKFETPLLWGIMFLGAGFSIKLAGELPLSLVVIFTTMALGFFFIFFLGKKLGLPDKLCALLAVGTTICGGSAIAVTSPLIKAREEETSYSVSTIVIAAFFLVVFLPFVGHALGLSQTAFGIWAGTAVHNTPQTIGAGYIFGEKAGQVATIVKLTRNMFMILAAVLISLWFGAKEAGEKRLGKKALIKAFPWVLFGYIAMAVFAVKGFFSPDGIHFFKSAGKFLILMGMVGIGFGTNFREIKKLGFRPLITGFIGAVVVTGVSLLLVWLLRFTG
ncbi:MAG: putative sulfate exporter family transporter [Candidatus Aminicenantes bacterium]|nr:putative sulfate exporter family transporter [Candidatus Aminicenantes bacterium]